MNRKNIRITGCELYFLALTMRSPLKSGYEVGTEYDTAKVKLSEEISDKCIYRRFTVPGAARADEIELRLSAAG